MNNLQRLEIETKGIQLDENEMTIYLNENYLDPTTEYDPESATNKKQIYQSALSALESIANNPTTMKKYKQDGMSIDSFHDNVMSRIDQLERKIRKLKTDEQIANETSFFMLFDQ